jgi:hypothetical protein
MPVRGADHHAVHRAATGSVQRFLERLACPRRTLWRLVILWCERTFRGRGSLVKLIFELLIGAAKTGDWIGFSSVS